MNTKMDPRALLGVLFSLLWLVAGIAAKPSGKTAKATVSYKETKGFCETTKNVKSYAGYVRFPAGSQYAPYEQNIFFWFFEARSKPKSAPLTVWLQGGPGMGSTSQALGGNGPCRVLDDSATTEVNEWSWNTHSNMLYIDQPVQAGFSYDTATPGRLELLTGALNPTEVTEDMIFMNGTFGSGDPSRMPVTTAAAAEAVWDFMQVWMAEKKFKDYRRDKISIWSQSYGGHWAPGIASHFLNKSPARSERAIGISNIGIFNGVVDFLVQGESFPEFARENTYGIEAYPQSVADDAIEAFEKPGGCKDQAIECQDLAVQLDPDNTGKVLAVQYACGMATDACSTEVYGPFLQYSGLNNFDITQDSGTQFPAPYAHGFLNRESVQKKLGVDIAGGKGVNYTYLNPDTLIWYASSGDYLRKDFRLQLGELLDQGVPVTLAHGDRDFTANWFGGEALSLQIPFDDSDDFGDAGYADFVVDGDVAGKTRQAGLLSFTRVFQAGHEVPYYTPKASHALFTRAHKNKDIPTGSAPASASNPSYSTTGPSSVRNVTDSPQGNAGSMFCYVMNPPLAGGQCSAAQLAGIADGSAIVEDFIVA